MAPPVTVLVNADIRTMEPERPRADAISFSGGRILDVGSGRRVRAGAGNRARVIDARGRTVLPGFIDCHAHFLSLGVWSRRLDLSATRSLPEVLDAVKRRADSARLVREGGGGKGKATAPWILGRGWDEARWPNQRYLVRQDLDSVCPDRPVMLLRICGHLATLNTKGLRELEGVIGTEDVDRRTGIVKEGAMERARRHLRPDIGEMLAGLRHSLELARKLGVTSVHDIIDLDKLGAYEAARREGLLTVRPTLHFEQGDFGELLRMGVRPGQGGPDIRIGGMKLYADGSFGARTAALERPYSDAPRERGALLHSNAALRSAVRDAERGGYQLLVHAIGDRAAREVVSAFASAYRSPTRLRHRIEHLELPGKAELARMRRLGLCASMQPNFVGEWGQPGGMMEARLGKARLRRSDPFRRVLRSGVPLVFGSDCMPLGPLYGIHSAVNAPFPGQRLTVGEAVAAYTRDAAAASFEEGFKGTLAPGKAADLVILSEDPFRHPRAIRSVRVAATFFDGNLVWSDDRRGDRSGGGRGGRSGEGTGGRRGDRTGGRSDGRMVDR